MAMDIIHYNFKIPVLWYILTLPHSFETIVF